VSLIRRQSLAVKLMLAGLTRSGPPAKNSLNTINKKSFDPRKNAV
jgi:hypothetical protein